MLSTLDTLKWILLALAEVEMLFFSGIGFGQNSLFPSLSNLSYFCTAINNTNPCANQQQYLGYLLITTIISYSLIAVPIGIFYDKFGNTKTKIICAIFISLGCLAYALSSILTQYLAYVAAILLGAFAQSILTCNFALTSLFPSYQNILVSIFSGSFDSSNFMMTFITLGYRRGTSILASFLILTFVTLLVCATTTLLVHYVNKLSVPETYTNQRVSVDKSKDNAKQEEVVDKSKNVAFQNELVDKSNENAEQGEAANKSNNVYYHNESEENNGYEFVDESTETEEHDESEDRSNKVALHLALVDESTETEEHHESGDRSKLTKKKKRSKNKSQEIVKPEDSEGQSKELTDKLLDKTSDEYLEAIINKRYPTLRSVLISRCYIMQISYLTILFFRFAFFLAELNLQLSNLFPGRKSLVNDLLFNSSYVLVCAIIGSPLPGIVVDKVRKRIKTTLHDVDESMIYSRYLLCFTPSFFFTTTLNIIMSILILIPTEGAIYCSYVAFMLMRMILFSTNSTYILNAFPKRFFGELFGIGVLVSGSMSFIQYGILFEDFAKLSMVNYILIAIVSITYIHPISLFFLK